MLCVSKELCHHVGRLSGRPEAVKLYHQGVDLSLFDSAGTKAKKENGTTEFILVGRFTEKKGHLYALSALAQVIQQGRDARLTFVGSGELEAACKKFVQDRNLSNNVRFLGTRTQEETATELAASDVALVPSVVAKDQDREGSPTVIREAAACGLPVIGTHHAGIPEIIDDQVTGFLVPERDAEALAASMLILTDESETRKTMGLAGRHKMEQEFDLYEQVKLLERHYDSVL